MATAEEHPGLPQASTAGILATNLRKTNEFQSTVGQPGPAKEHPGLPEASTGGTLTKNPRATKCSNDSELGDRKIVELHFQDNCLRSIEFHPEVDVTTHPDTVSETPELPDLISYLYVELESVHPLIRGTYAKVLLDRKSSLSEWLYCLITGVSSVPYFSTKTLNLSQAGYTFTLDFLITPRTCQWNEYTRTFFKPPDPMIILGKDLLDHPLFHSITKNYMIFKDPKNISKLKKLPFTYSSHKNVINWIDSNFKSGPLDPMPKTAKNQQPKSCRCQKKTETEKNTEDEEKSEHQQKP